MYSDFLVKKKKTRFPNLKNGQFFSLSDEVSARVIQVYTEKREKTRFFPNEKNKKKKHKKKTNARREIKHGFFCYLLSFSLTFKITKA